MAVVSADRTVTIALVGNPNTGKSTLFNALCGLRQRVGNFPGVTVEKKSGRADFGEHSFEIVDLPGSYSLAPRSPDEMIAVDFLLGRLGAVPPDVVVCIVDASNLQRNLYLLSQLLEFGIPTVLALNMVDVARDKGVQLEVDQLRSRLGIPVVEIQANRQLGLEELRNAIIQAITVEPPRPQSPLPEAFQQEVKSLAAAWEGAAAAPIPAYLVTRLLLDTTGYIAELGIPGVTPDLLEKAASARQRLSDADCPIPAVEAIARYGWINELTADILSHPVRDASFSDRLDRVLTHRLWGTLAFVLLMLLLFQSVFLIAEPASWLIDTCNGFLGSLVGTAIGEGALRSLLVNGVIEGVGGVLVFLPQIFLLFFFIAILEDCGYMARAAYLMDKMMSKVGLSGKSFIPLLSSFACAIPGIMAARVIENPKDRLITILVAPLMTCSARLPVYTLLIGAFVPNTTIMAGWIGYQGLTMFALYGLGIVAAVLTAWLLRKTVLRGGTPPFVMELPNYKLPSPAVVTHRVLDRGWAFVRRAGTLIFAVTVVVWAAGYYPHDASQIDPALLLQQQELLEQRRFASAAEQALVDDELTLVAGAIEGSYLRNSFLGRAGQFVAPIVRPLGWDWRIGCAVIASFPAREVVIATLSVIYNLGDAEDEQSLRDTLRSATWDGSQEKVFSLPTALSVMVFFALCAQCASTFVVMRRETNGWKWPAVAFIYMTSAAYLAAFLTFQIGVRILG